MNRFFLLLLASFVFIGCGSIKREYKTPIDLSAAVDTKVAELNLNMERVELLEEGQVSAGVTTSEVSPPFSVTLVSIEEKTLPPVEVVLSRKDFVPVTMSPELLKEIENVYVQLGESDIALDYTMGEAAGRAHLNTLLRRLHDKQRAEEVAVDRGPVERHIVAQGETFAGIMSGRGVFSRTAELAAFNKLEDPDMIFIGQSLWVPVAVILPRTPEVAPAVANDVVATDDAQTDSSAGRFSPPPRAQHTEEVTVVAEGGRTDSASAEPVADTDETVVQGSSGWTDGTPEQRSAPNVQPGDAGTNPEDKRVAELEGALRGERLLRSHEKQRFWTVVVLVIVLPVVVFVLTFWLGRKGLKKEVGELEDSIYEVQRDREGLQEQVSNLKTRLDKLEADRHRLQRENKTLEARLSVPPENLYEEVFRGLREQNDDLRTRLDVFREKLPEEVLSLFDEADTREKQEALLRPFWERMDHELVNMTRAHVIPTSCEETDPAIPRITTSDDGVVQPFGPRGRRGTKAS